MTQTQWQWASFIFGIVCASGTFAQSGSGLENLMATTDGTSRRASSSDPDWDGGGNADARFIAPGDTLVLADLDGPGVIRHIWFTISAPEAQHSRLLALRMYWDDEEHPSVEAPIGDFFAMGHGLDRELESAPVAVTSGGRARNCYWPMPFRKGARIEVTNEGTMPVNAFYFYIDWEQVPSLPLNTAYFHAMYRQEYPAQFESRYTLADIDGKGHYVGTVQSVRARTPGWIGEGDDFFYIDGEKVPSLKGTGTEDYFCDAWGFREMTRPYYGAPLYEGEKTGDRTTVYRWHIMDPIRFNKSLHAEIEHVGPNGLARDGSFAPGYGTRLDDIASVAFWYQIEPHKAWQPMPIGAARLYPAETDGLYLNADAYPPYVKLMVGKALFEADTSTISIDTNGANSQTFRFSIENPTSLTADVSLSIESHGAAPEAPSIPVQTLAPGERKDVTISLPEVATTDPRALQPLPIEAVYSLHHPAGGTMTYTLNRTAVFTTPYALSPTSRKIAVDGDLNDWDELPFVVTQPAQLQFDPAGWKGPEDCQYRFDVRYDDAFVYVAVRVLDDSQVVRPGDLPWLQDGVEIRLTALPEAERADYDGKDEFSRSVLLAMSPMPEGQDTVAYNSARLPDGARYACRPTDTGFAAEIAIPTAALDAQQGQPWSAVRINIAIDDRDGDQMTQLWWRPDWRTQQSFAESGTFVKTK